LQARLQNDKLLRALNADLLELQRRARAHLAKRGGPKALTEVSEEARYLALRLAAEALQAAVEAFAAEFTPEPGPLEELFARHFSFVEATGGLAMPRDLGAQLLRLAALLDSQALLNALQKQAKASLLACCETLANESRVAAVALLERRFEALCNSVIASRMA